MVDKQWPLVAGQVGIRAFPDAPEDQQERSQSVARLLHNHLKLDSLDNQAAVVEPCLGPDKLDKLGKLGAAAFREVSKKT